ncbi:hypothetical protein ACOTWK_05855 [Aliarcobacter butzleri]
MPYHQEILIKNDENTIYMQIEECSKNHYEVQISNEWYSITDNYILDENNRNKIFQNGKDAFEYIVNNFFTQPIKALKTRGTYFVNENELKAISKLNIIEIV